MKTKPFGTRLLIAAAGLLSIAVAGSTTANNADLREPVTTSPAARAGTARQTETSQQSTPAPLTQRVRRAPFAPMPAFETSGRVYSPIWIGRARPRRIPLTAKYFVRA
ncbi:MAG: hypothetical protein ABIY52_12490 [Gemmatimonadaceae bacterium]